MFLDDPIDGQSAFRKPIAQPRSIIKARHLVYAHLVVVFPFILIARAEELGHPGVLNSLSSGIGAIFWIPMAFSPLIFPLAILIRLLTESPREKWSWAALPLSIALTFVQFLALLPGVA
jgi:hypothetical protein